MKGLIFLSLASIGLLSCSSVPHRIWPQKDMQAREINTVDFPKKVLIASRASDFKKAVVSKVVESLKTDSVYIKIIGLSKIMEESTSAFQAIVLINTNMGRNLDPNAKAFLAAHPNQGNIIVLTTSGDGRWVPEKKNGRFDAIASPSRKGDPGKIAETLMAKIRPLLFSGN